MTKHVLVAQIINKALPPGFGGDPADQDTAFVNYVVLLWRTLIILGGLAALVFLIWGALDWILAGGEESKIAAARKKMTGAVIGLVLLSSTVAIVTLIERLLGISLLKIEFPTPGQATP